MERKKQLNQLILLHENKMFDAHFKGENVTANFHRNRLLSCCDELEVIEQQETLSLIY